MPPNSTWRPDTPQPPVGPKLPIPTGGSQPPFINRQLAGVLAIIVAAWPTDGQPAPIQPEQTLGVRVAKIAPLTLVYGSQPPPNGPFGGSFERQTRTAIFSWPGGGEPVPIQPEQIRGVRTNPIAPLTLVYGSQPPPRGQFTGAADVQNEYAVQSWWPSDGEPRPLRQQLVGTQIAPLTLPYGQQPPITSGLTPIPLSVIVRQWPQDQEPRPLQPSQTLGVRQDLIAPLTLTYGQQPPPTSGLPNSPLSVILGQWPDKWWPAQTAAPNAGWNVPPPAFVPTPPQQPQIVVEWQPAWYGPPKPVVIAPLTLTYGDQPPKTGPLGGSENVQNLSAISSLWPSIWWPPQKAPPAVPQTQSLQPPPTQPLSTGNAALINQAWVPPWMEPPSTVEVASSISVPLPYVTYPISSILSWSPAWYGPPVPVTIAPLTFKYGSQPQSLGIVVSQEDTAGGIWRTNWTLVRSRPNISANFVSPSLPPGDVILSTPYPIAEILASTPPWYPAQDTRKLVQGIIPAPYVPPGTGAVETLLNIVGTWTPPWVEPPWPVEIAPVLPLPPPAPPIFAIPPRAILDSWFVDPTTYIPLTDVASILPPGGDAPPISGAPTTTNQLNLIERGWPPTWWPSQSAPKSIPVTQAAPPPPTQPISSQNSSILEQAWVPPWMEPPSLVEVSPLIPVIVPPLLTPVPQPHIIGSWPSIWWADQSEPFSVPITQGSQPSPIAPLSAQNRSTISLQWPPIWWPAQTAAPNAGWNVPPIIPPPPHVPYPIGVIFSTQPPWYGPPVPVSIAPLTFKYGSQPPILPPLVAGVVEAIQLAQPAWYGPPPPVVIAPLTLAYGQQPPKNGSLVGAEDVENLLAISQWPAIWWPSQRAPFGAAELFIPPALPISLTNYQLIIRLWPQPEALPKGTTLTPAWHLGLPFQPAYDQRIIYRQIRGYTVGERFDITRQVPNIRQNRRLVKAWLTIKIAVDDPDNEAVIQKIITTTPVNGLGWISDDGSSSKVGQLIFQLMEADTTLLGYRHIYTYDIQLEFDNGEIATKEIGDISLLQRLTNANS